MINRGMMRYLLIGVLSLTMLMCSTVPTSIVQPSLSPDKGDPAATIISMQKTIDKLNSTATSTLIPTNIKIANSPTDQVDLSTPTLAPSPEGLSAGNLGGKLSFPGEAIPPLRIVAFLVENGVWTKSYQFVDIVNKDTYQINDLRPGKYWIVAYLVSEKQGNPVLAGGYTKAVLCGLSVDCTDHTLVQVEVKPGETVLNIDPGDWYAESGAFPKNPTLP
jgi:hypothetical protein